MELASGRGIAGLVLAGGAGRRIGGAKALVQFDGKPLVQRAAERLAPQVETLWLSVRGAPEPVAALGYALVTDDEPEAAGPLAGIVAGLRRASAAGYRFLAVVPCDAPFLPGDLVTVLAGGLGEAAVAIIADENIHPTVSLWRTSTLAGAEVTLAAGRRRLRQLCTELGAVEVGAPAHWPASALFNINTREDLIEASTAMMTREAGD